MPKKELQVEIEVLHRQGKGIREIERATGHSRSTIRAILRGRSDRHYGPRRPTKVEVPASASPIIESAHELSTKPRHA
jgi:transposase